MNETADLMACLRAICEALIKAEAVTRAQIAEAAQEHLLNQLEALPPEQKESAFPLLRAIVTSIEQLSHPAQRG